MKNKKLEITNEDKNIGKRIKYLRNNINLSQESFSNKINISKGNLSDLENLKYYPSYSVLVSIIKAFKINSSWLLMGNGSMYGNSCINKQMEIALNTIGEIENKSFNNVLEKSIRIFQIDPDSIENLNDYVNSLYFSIIKEKNRRIKDRRKLLAPHYTKKNTERRSGNDRRVAYN